MKKSVILLLLILIALQTDAQKIYWLLFIDTKDTDVGQFDINGRELLKNEFVDPINEALNDFGFDYKVYDCYGDDCSPEMLESTVKSLTCNDNDIIFFYYIGHGGRSVNEEDDAHPWPQMYLGQTDERKFVDLEVLHNKLKQKNPRLLVTVGMCCNSYADIPKHNNNLFTTTANYGGLYELSDEENEMIVNMLTTQCGELLATSARPGQTSKATQLGNYKPMDCYTTALVANFHFLIGDDNLTLNNLFSGTQETVASLDFVNRRNKPDPQTPFFVAHLQSGTCDGIIPDPIPPEPDPVVVNQLDLQSIKKLLDTVIKNRTAPPMDNFTSDCVVRVLAKEGRTQVDKVPAKIYLSRISSSKLIIEVVPVKITMRDGKISELYVKEIRTERRY